MFWKPVLCLVMRSMRAWRPAKAAVKKAPAPITKASRRTSRDALPDLCTILLTCRALYRWEHRLMQVQGADEKQIS